MIHDETYISKRFSLILKPFLRLVSLATDDAAKRRLVKYLNGDDVAELQVWGRHGVDKIHNVYMFKVQGCSGDIRGFILFVAI